MSDEYDLSIFELKEGEEYFRPNCPDFYRLKDKVLEVSGRHRERWSKSMIEIDTRFKLLPKKKTVTFYRHFYLRGNKKESSDWVGECWEDWAYAFTRAPAFLHTDTREFPAPSGEVGGG